MDRSFVPKQPFPPPAFLPPLRDRIKPGVRVLFVGINPGIRSSLTGHHFAGFSNRFWNLLFESGLVPERVTYQDDDRLPPHSNIYCGARVMTLVRSQPGRTMSAVGATLPI